MPCLAKPAQATLRRAVPALPCCDRAMLREASPGGTAPSFASVAPPCSAERSTAPQSPGGAAIPSWAMLFQAHPRPALPAVPRKARSCPALPRDAPPCRRCDAHPCDTRPCRALRRYAKLRFAGSAPPRQAVLLGAWPHTAPRRLAGSAKLDRAQQRAAGPYTAHPRTAGFGRYPPPPRSVSTHRLAGHCRSIPSRALSSRPAHATPALHRCAQRGLTGPLLAVPCQHCFLCRAWRCHTRPRRALLCRRCAACPSLA